MYRIIVRPGVPEVQRAVTRTVCKKLNKIFKVKGNLRIVLIAAAEFPDWIHGGYELGFFAEPTNKIKSPSIYLATLLEANTLEEVIAHEWGHFEQWCKSQPLWEGRRIEKKERKYMRELRK